MALIDDFKARFPEFDTAVVDQYLPILESVWPCYYGGTYEDCDQEVILNLLAHLLVSETTAGNGNTKSINSQTVGNVSVSYGEGYASTSERSAWLKTTKYGMRYLMLTRKRSGGVFV